RTTGRRAAPAAPHSRPKASSAGRARSYRKRRTTLLFYARRVGRAGGPEPAPGNIHAGGVSTGATMQHPGFPVATTNAAPTTAVAPFDLTALQPDSLALAAVPRAVAERFRLVPIQHRGDALVVAMVDPGDVYTIDEIARLAGCRVVPVAANPMDIQTAISRLYTAAGYSTVED